MNAIEETQINATKPKTISPREKWLNIGILSFLTIAGIIISLKFDLPEIENFLKTHPSWTVLISLVVYTLMGLTVVPSEPLVIVVAYNIGIIPAIIVTAVGQTLASLLEYYEGTLLDNAVDIQTLTTKLPKKFQNLPVNSPIFQFIARILVPKPLALVSGALRVSLFTYLVISLIQNALGSTIFALAGLGVLHIVVPSL